MGHEVERSDLIRIIVFPVIMAGLAFTGHSVGRVPETLLGAPWAQHSDRSPTGLFCHRRKLERHAWQPLLASLEPGSCNHPLPLSVTRVELAVGHDRCARFVGVRLLVSERAVRGQICGYRPWSWSVVAGGICVQPFL